MQDAFTYLLENNKYYHANHVHVNQEALQQLPEDGNLLLKVEHLHTHLYSSQSHHKIHMELTSLHHFFQMLHSKGRSERQCSSPFRISRLGHHAASCGLPLEELQAMSSLLRDILVWPSQPYSPLVQLTSLDNAATKLPSETILPIL